MLKKITLDLVYNVVGERTRSLSALDQQFDTLHARLDQTVSILVNQRQ